MKAGEQSGVYNWKQAGWPKASCNRAVLRDELAAQGAILPEGLGGPETRYRLNVSPREPIEGINEGINDWLLKLIVRHPGVRLPYLKSVVGASTATIERALATLVKTGKIEHRGSKKTGGYFLV